MQRFQVGSRSKRRQERGCVAEVMYLTHLLGNRCQMMVAERAMVCVRFLAPGDGRRWVGSSSALSCVIPATFLFHTPTQRQRRGNFMSRSLIMAALHFTKPSIQGSSLKSRIHCLPECRIQGIGAVRQLHHISYQPIC